MSLATLLTSNAPFTPQDLEKIRSTSKDLDYQILYLPDEPLGMEQLKPVLASATRWRIWRHCVPPIILTFLPPTDASPVFLQLRAPSRDSWHSANSRRPLGSAAAVDVFDAIHAGSLDSGDCDHRLAGSPVDSLSTGGGARTGRSHPLFHRHRPGLHAGGNGHDAAALHFPWAADLFAGCGARRIDPVCGRRQPRFRPDSHRRWLEWPSPGIARRAGPVDLFVCGFAGDSCGDGRTFVAAHPVSLALVAPCGFIMGFCFPVGMRWATLLGQEVNLPWMWALNGAASVLASFIAILISTETSIRACILTGAACYALGGILLSGKGSTASARAQLEDVAKPIAAR